jgi:hypothetical protein
MPDDQDTTQARAASVLRAHMTMHSSTGETIVVPLPDAPCSVSIGRSERSDIALPVDPTVSRLHAVLQLIAGEWLLVDDGISRNGTHVNQRRIAGRRRLRDGDRVQVGHTELVFHAPVTAPERHLNAGVRPPAAHRRVMAELVRPLRERATGVTATDTEIGLRLGVPTSVVTGAIADLFALYGISYRTSWQRRDQLARIVLDLGFSGAAAEAP